jgi:hypothetical protein
VQRAQNAASQRALQANVHQHFLIGNHQHAAINVVCAILLPPVPQLQMDSKGNGEVAA